MLSYYDLFRPFIDFNDFLMTEFRCVSSNIKMLTFLKMAAKIAGKKLNLMYLCFVVRYGSN